MTLKEKFDKLIVYPFSEYKEQMKILKEENNNELEKIADDFVIDFSEWIAINDYRYYSNGWSKVWEKGTLTSKELLEIYKKEKGL